MRQRADESDATCVIGANGQTGALARPSSQSSARTRTEGEAEREADDCSVSWPGGARPPVRPAVARPARTRRASARPSTRSGRRRALGDSAVPGISSGSDGGGLNNTGSRIELYGSTLVQDRARARGGGIFKLRHTRRHRLNGPREHPRPVEACSSTSSAQRPGRFEGATTARPSAAASSTMGRSSSPTPR